MHPQDQPAGQFLPSGHTPGHALRQRLREKALPSGHVHPRQADLVATKRLTVTGEVRIVGERAGGGGEGVGPLLTVGDEHVVVPHGETEVSVLLRTDEGLGHRLLVLDGEGHDRDAALIRVIRGDDADRHPLPQPGPDVVLEDQLGLGQVHQPLEQLCPEVAVVVRYRCGGTSPAATSSPASGPPTDPGRGARSRGCRPGGRPPAASPRRRGRRRTRSRTRRARGDPQPGRRPRCRVATVAVRQERGPRRRPSRHQAPSRGAAYRGREWTGRTAGGSLALLHGAGERSRLRSDRPRNPPPEAQEHPFTQVRDPLPTPGAARPQEAVRFSGGTQPIAGATCRTTFSRSRALNSTPSMFGTVISSVSASRTAASLASSSASRSGSPT